MKRIRRFVDGPRRGFSITRTLEANLWHIHDPELLPVALRLARSGHKVIWDAHEDYSEQLGSKDSKTWVRGPARRIVQLGTRALLCQVDKYAIGIIAATPTIANRYSNPRTVVVGNEARLEYFLECRPSFDSRQILFTGSVGSAHLFEEVVEAISLLHDLTLVVAGREPDPKIWQRSREILGERIRHVGWLDRQALAGAINESVLGLVTYADFATNAHNAPNKLFEFAAAGLPVIATPTASNTSAISKSNAGFVASGFSGKQLAEKVNEALSDRTTWEQVSQSARKWAQESGSWANSERALLNLYADVFRISGI